jgi:hypothetical protein
LDPEFAARFAEASGSTKPAEIQRLLNISYQAARNYLDGRLPDPQVLISISKKTGYSIHWLLTGEGEPFVGSPSKESKPLPARQMTAFVRSICVEVINEMLEKAQEPNPKVVVLQSSEIMSEKADVEPGEPVNRFPDGRIE